MLCLPRSRGISLLVGLRFTLVQNTQQLGHDIAFPKPPIHFEDYCVCLNNYNNKNNTFSPFSLQMIGNIPILLNLHFFFIKIKPSHFTGTLVRTDQCFHPE